MSEQSGGNAIALLGAGILGFCGVGAAAMSAHSGSDAQLASAVALVCLTHAPALVALSARREILLRIAALVLFVGAALFSADIGLRMFGYGRLFPMAAPAGGMTMMAGWLAVAVATFTARR